MVWAIVVALLLLSPTTALATPEDEQKVTSQIVTDNSDVIQRLDDLENTMLRNQGNTEVLLSAIEVTLSNIEKYVQPKPEEKEPEDQKDTEDYLIEIESELEQINAHLGEEIPQEQKSVTRAQNFNFVAYANASPTNQYASYASGLIPRMKWSEHYVFLQDTSSSYVLVWGDTLAYTANNTFAGTSCRYVRWFYANQTNGYQTESGTADVSVSTSGHVVLSDLANYPMLAGTEEHNLRIEVAFYACVALVIRTLHHVWRFTLRNGNGTMAD